MICAVLLAAGRSRRMGTQKLLLPFGGRTVIAHIADQVLQGPIARMVVVVGHDGARIAEALAGRTADAMADRPLEFVINPDPQGEMLSSVRCGLRVLPPACEAVLVVLGDQPGITTDLIARMVHAFLVSAIRPAEARRFPGVGFPDEAGAPLDLGVTAGPSGGSILVPVYEGKRGHPILFSASYLQEVLTRYDDVGLRGLLQGHPQDVLELPVTGSLLLADMDCPEDYRRELEKLPERAGPGPSGDLGTVL